MSFKEFSEKVNSSKKINMVVQLLVIALMAALLLYTMYNALLMKYNGDNYFMFAHAKVLFEEGFVKKDPLSMHTDYDFMMTQWLYAAVIYLIKSFAGNQAVFVFQYAVFLLIGFMMYKIARLFIKDNTNAVIFAVVQAWWLFHAFLNIRPYFLTVLLCLCEIFVLEKYLKDGKEKGLLWLLPISVLMINTHNALWIALSLVMLCYLAEALLDAIRGKGKRRLFVLLLIWAAVLLCGLINPYGFGYIDYILRSLDALGPLYERISELQPSLKTREFIGLLITDIGALAAFFFIKKKTVPARHFLLMAGFGVMAAMNIRNNILWFSCGQIGLMYAASFLSPVFEGEHAAANIRRLYMMLSGCGAIFIAAVAFCVSPLDHIDDSIFTACDRFAQIEPDRSVKIFNTFNNGGYLEYLGYHPYVDPRAEMHGKSVNGVKDISTEYVDVYYNASAEEFLEFCDDYGFEYLVVEKSESFEERTMKTGAFEVLYSDDRGEIFGRKKDAVSKDGEE